MWEQFFDGLYPIVYLCLINGSFANVIGSAGPNWFWLLRIFYTGLMHYLKPFDVVIIIYRESVFVSVPNDDVQSQTKGDPFLANFQIILVFNPGF